MKPKNVGETLKLKNKLIVAYVIMFLSPMMIITTASCTIVYFQLNSIQKSYDMETSTYQVISNPIQILNRLTRGVYNEIKLTALKQPEQFANEKYIKGLNGELKDKYSFITVRKNNDIIYTGNEQELNLIKNSLPLFGIYNTDVDGGIYLGGKNPFLVKFQDFYFDDGAEGTIFVITNLNNLVPQIKTVAIQTISALVLAITFTASFIVWWIYRGILKPLNILRIATNKIKEGDLNHSVRVVADNEIGQLCEDFEEMRIRLKKLIEDRLQYEEDMKELVSNISHDLKTHLTTIKGYAEGLIDGVADTPEKREKYLKTIFTKANDMSYLVDELSLFVRLDCDTVPYSFKAINLKDYFADCTEELEIELEVYNVKIYYNNETDPSTQVIADPEQLKRVINNIVSNSVKYMDKNNGIIDIRISDLEDYVQIDIKDNGSGIDSEDLPYIFDRFYRADTSRNSKKGGSGLGLSIVKKIIEDHYGRIWVSSEKWKGTTISFTLKKKR
ncbi:MAG: HAMP domain-containing histidine kinase [Clostridiales bacterium]|nr:HAMP domain-containing histidine kinase [Clostridiales bacterium]